MHLIIAGCEYSGSTTLSQTFGEWGAANMEGGRWGPNEYHDHWKLPHISNFSPPAPDEIANVVECFPDARDGDYTRTGLSHEEQAQIMALSPKLKEMVQRYHLQYHLHPVLLQAGRPHHGGSALRRGHPRPHLLRLRRRRPVRRPPGLQSRQYEKTDTRARPRHHPRACHRLSRMPFDNA